ncbi:hypothetical protein [Stenotrophomonas sp. AB1(2024)]|uniref:hypothetical protein n=1 Tax=Stenotrophomonas sp. AB1(2024) TaxID=3132215 RepID=UPI00309FD7D1
MANASPGHAAPPETDTLSPALARFLRRCPLLPSELSLLESRLQHLLSEGSPDALGQYVSRAMKDMPLMDRPGALERALFDWDAGLPLTTGAWRRECARVVASLVSGVGRLQCQRAAGIALHAVANLAVGAQGARWLSWSQQAMALPRLLQEGTPLAWLRWLCQLPLPSLRGGAWVEPLIASLPGGLEALLQHADNAHDTLHRQLELPSSPLRLVLLGTAWALWFRQRPPAPPATAAGRQLARLPAALDQLDLAGSAARRLFATPPAAAMLPGAAMSSAPPAARSAGERARLLAPALPVALATAALSPAISPLLRHRGAATVACGLATAAAGGGLVAWALDNAYQTAVAQIGERIERVLFLQPPSREARALGEALALRVAVLPVGDDITMQARVVLDLPVARDAPNFRQALRALCGLGDDVDEPLLDAAAGWALRRPTRSLAASEPEPSPDPAVQDEAAVQDQVALIDALWTLRDAASAAGNAALSRIAFTAAPDSPFARALLSVREQLGWLYRQEDFLATLYAERLPPSTLVVYNGTLTGTRATSGTVIVLHPVPHGSDSLAWSPPTEALLANLHRNVLDAGGCFDNAVEARLACALGFYLGEDVSTQAHTPPALDRLIQRLERTVQQLPDGHIAPTNETATLRRLHAQVRQAKGVPIRGLEPAWSSWRPDPRSHLGHNTALARSLLLQVSQHTDVIALCWHHHVDPAQLVYPAHGPVYAHALQGTRKVALFEAGHPPAALAALDTMLRGIATLLHAPVRSDGRLRVPEMLAYYAAPLPAIPMDDAPFDASLAMIEAQLAPQHLSPLGSARVEVQWDARSDSPAQQDHQRLLDRLWAQFDTAPHTLDQALAHQMLLPTFPSPLHMAWRDAQQQLQRVFEQTEVWLEMRRVNASYPSLRVGADGLTARVRGSGRSVVIIDGLSAALPPLLAHPREALYRMTDRLGRFSPGASVPLVNALQFHGALPLPVRQPCPAAVACTQAQLLDAIARIHERWQRHAAPLPRWQEASNELQDLGRVLMHRPDAATTLYRPALGTSTAALLQTALQPLAQLIVSPGLLEAMEEVPLPLRWMAVDAAGHVHVQDELGNPHTFNGSGPWQHSSLAQPLAQLRDVAGRLGGHVRSDGRVFVSDTLAAHGGCGPGEATHVDGAGRCAERLLGELRLGMRPELLHAADALSADDVEQVRQTTTRFLAQRAPAGQTLLEYLALPLLQQGEIAPEQLHRSSHYVARMARTPRATALQTALLRELGWYLGSAVAPTSPTLLGSLTREAIILDLGPASDRDARILLGYRLHKYPNWGRTFAQIRQDFHDYLRSMGRIPDSLLGLAGTLALQELAPELLPGDVPANLVYGNTIASIHYVSGVHLAERLRRGLSQQMRFSELITFAADLGEGSGTPDLVRQLILDARRLPTLDWYVFRQLDHQAPLPVPPPERIEAALRAFDQRVADIERAIADVLAPLPYRMPLVEAEIRRVFPRFPGVLSDQPWNSTDFRLCNDDNLFGSSFPFFEVVAAGALRTGAGQWRPCRRFAPSSPLNPAQGNPRFEAAQQDAFALMKPGLARMADINARYQKRFDAYFRKAQRGYGVLIEEALYQRPEEERAALRRGDVQVFTLRTHTDLEAQQETRDDTDHYRGRFGVVYTLQVDGQPRHFQLFPLQSRIVPLTLEGPLPIGGELQNRKVRLRSGNFATIRVRRGTSLEVDWEAYASDRALLDGSSSDVIVEPLLARPVDANDTAAHSPFHALVEPVRNDFFWLDAAAFRREGWAPTSYEEHLDDAPLWLKTVYFIVPFVENLRGLSKNRNEFAMAAFGLYLEAIIVVGPVIGGMAKVLMRPGLKMTLPRFTELSRVLGRGTLDALNPAAGSLAVLRIGSGIVQRTARGNLRFLWAVVDPQRPDTRVMGVRWAMREGMAVAKVGSSLASPLHEIKVRTVDDIPHVLVSPPPGAGDGRTLHLVDPATLTLHGPALQERLGEGGGAAGMLIKVGGNPRTPHVSPGKALKPIKQGPKASEEQPDDDQPPLQPPVVVLPDPPNRLPQDARA